MAIANNWLTGQINLPDEVLTNVLNLVASIQKAAQKGSFRPQQSTNVLDQSFLIESLIEEYEKKL